LTPATPVTYDAPFMRRASAGHNAEDEGHMHRRSTLIGMGLLALALHGCGSNPLIGNWSTTVSPQTDSTLTLGTAYNADGTVTYTITGTGMCTGSLSYSGLRWASTSNTLTVSGTATCSGAGVTCPGSAGMLTCGSTGPAATTCNYALSSNNMSLTLSGCTMGADVFNATYTRN
jgi:hypothetical protein